MIYGQCEVCGKNITSTMRDGRPWKKCFDCGSKGGAKPANGARPAVPENRDRSMCLSYAKDIHLGLFAKDGKFDVTAMLVTADRLLAWMKGSAADTVARTTGARAVDDERVPF